MASRFQFSIRFLLVATVAVAAGAAAVRAEPSTQATLAIDALTVVFLTCTIVGIAHTGGSLRIFWIGASIVLGLAMILAAISLWTLLIYWGNMPAGRLYPLHGKVAAVWCAAPVNGLLAAFLHWLFSPGKDAIRLSRLGIAALLLLSLASIFFVGVWFGESREFDRRTRADQEEQELMNEELENEEIDD